MARQRTRKKVAPEVRDLRELLLAARIPMRAIADRFGVSPEAILQQFDGTRPMQERTLKAARELLAARHESAVRTALQAVKAARAEL